MPANSHDTRERILLAALELFYRQGIRKTGVAEVAALAGVTRITVYRYFPTKQALAREAFILGERVFERGVQELGDGEGVKPEQVLRIIGEGLDSMPYGDILVRLEELWRLYPEAYADFQKVRGATLGALFEGLFAAAERQRTLRPGLDRRIVEAVFSEFVLGFFEKPKSALLGMSNQELYAAVTDFLLHGMLRSEAPARAARRKRISAKARSRKGGR